MRVLLLQYGIGKWRKKKGIAVVRLPDGTPIRVVMAPEIVYGPRTAALAQAAYTREGVSACRTARREYMDPSSEMAPGVALRSQAVAGCSHETVTFCYHL